MAALIFSGRLVITDVSSAWPADQLDMGSASTSASNSASPAKRHDPLGRPKDMKAILLGVYVLFGLLPLQAEFVASSVKPELVIEYHTERKRGDIIEWSCPVFASYTDGTVIWRRNWRNSLDSLATATAPELRDAIDDLSRIVKENNGRVISLGDGTDGPITVVWSSGHKISITGDWRQNVPGSDSAERQQYREGSMPKEIFELLERFVAFDSSMGVSWRPETVIVTLFPAGPALGQPVLWPRDWPNDFSKTEISTRTLRRVFPGTMLPDLIAFLSVGGQSRAVLFQEPKFAEIELVFPGDRYWRLAWSVVP